MVVFGCDVVGALTDSQNPQVYWRVLKKRLRAEGNETVTNCNVLKMTAQDGKMRLKTHLSRFSYCLFLAPQRRQN